MDYATVFRSTIATHLPVLEHEGSSKEAIAAAVTSITAILSVSLTFLACYDYFLTLHK